MTGKVTGKRSSDLGLTDGARMPPTLQPRSKRRPTTEKKI